MKKPVLLLGLVAVVAGCSSTPQTLTAVAPTTTVPLTTTTVEPTTTAVTEPPTTEAQPVVNHEEESPPLGGGYAGGTLESIRNCESGGNYGYDDGLFSGAYNYLDSTWQAAGGSTARAAEASPAEQDAVTLAYIESGHRGEWPNC